MLDDTENSRRRIWYVASYGQYEATCPTRRLESYQARPQKRGMAVTRRLSFYIVNYSHAPFFELGPQNEKHVAASRRFVFKIVVGEL